MRQSSMGRYFAELDVRFANGFDPGDGGADHDAVTMAAPGGAFVVVRTDGDVIGCGGVLRLDDDHGRDQAHVDPPRVAWRRASPADCWRTSSRERARLGRARVVLDTNESLTEAIAMYHRFGYAPTGRYNDNPYAHHWFEKHLEPVGRRPD